MQYAILAPAYHTCRKGLQKHVMQKLCTVPKRLISHFGFVLCVKTFISLCGFVFCEARSSLALFGFVLLFAGQTVH